MEGTVPIAAGGLARASAATSRSKRLLDIILAGTGLVILIPVFAVSALTLVLSSGRPVFYSQIRVGRNGRRFRIWKFRTMVRGAEQLQAKLQSENQAPFPAFKLRQDPRVTRIGLWLRRSSVDELPQLWNVLRGDMSLVGPRPPLPQEVAHYDAIAWRRLSVRPGLTCVWQVEQRHHDGGTFQDWVRRDLDYIESWSLANDFRLLAKTVIVVLRMTGH